MQFTDAVHLPRVTTPQGGVGRWWEDQVRPKSPSCEMIDSNIPMLSNIAPLRDLLTNTYLCEKRSYVH